MKRLLSICLFLLFVSTLGAENNILMMATTTSTDNTGFLDYLQKKVKKDLNINLRWLAVGTGKALRHGENCDVDVLLVHAENEEKKFMEKGYGIKRVQFMYNDFVLLGPINDPLNISGMDILDAMKKIFNNGKIKFVSRGDESGTHLKEKELWLKCCKNIPLNKTYYIENGRGMMETILMSDEMEGYTLADRSTYLMYKNNIKNYRLKIISEGNELLRNPYSIIVINPKKCPNVKLENANKFLQWLLTKETKQYIEEYSINGEQLFKIIYK
jgi:tungstate transport system substrate-binding protein